ncbi:MAG: RNHCP domain-containing protein [Candidatus Vogelbacteria bacterium]|nr:RNHCP domain-containing protein [Candidatus Vogelbacteria bacterium]
MKNFKKNKEDFTCEKCSFFVVGNGYTNHCPECLWSKHVDVIPGDRLDLCCGLMEPSRFEKDGGEEALVHRCMACGHEKRNKLSQNDNYDKVISLVKSRIG